MRLKGFDWRLQDGIATPANLAIFLLALACFPLVLRWTGALSVASIDPASAQHTSVFLRFCLVVTGYLALCFGIAYAGIKTRNRMPWTALIGAQWPTPSRIAKDLGIALATLAAMFIVGNLSNLLLGPFQHDSAAFRSLVAHNAIEAVAFLIPALIAGFIEEFIFRGYLQRQLTALVGNTALAAIMQVAIFTVGHLYQGWIRLIPVMLLGAVLTTLALLRKSLVPGMIAHGMGDSLVAFIYLAKQL